MISPCRELEAGSSKDLSHTNLFRILKTKSVKAESGDQRTMDAADTLVSLAHSASSTPTVEFKPFRPADEVIEKTINLDEIGADPQNTSLLESACKMLVEQVLKSCPSADLSSITIKAKRAAQTESDDAKKSKRADSDSDTDSLLRGRPAPTLATGRRSRDLELPPDEARKRQDRRERNKQAAARCRRRREELAETLSLKTNQLSQEQENLKKNYDDLIKEKLKLENLFNEHVKECGKEKSATTALTPISAGLNQKENFLNYLETNEKNKNVLTRPNNLNLKNTTSSSNNLPTLVTPSSATLNSVLQGIALAFGQATTPGSFTIGSNNNISFVMTPTFLNTPTAFLSLTPIESQFGTLNTPMLAQSNPLLSIQDSTGETKNTAKS